MRALQGQEVVYKEVSSLVAAVMEGANGCVLAFGQSGSGKAHTLAGTPQHPGINFRAMSHLFKCAPPTSPLAGYALTSIFCLCHILPGEKGCCYDGVLL